MITSRNVSLVAFSLLGLLCLAVATPLRAESCKDCDDLMITNKVNTGQFFVIALPADFTNGFQWHLASPVNKQLLNLINSKYIPQPNRVSGHSGIEYWTFEALHSGTTKISMEYRGPADNDTRPTETRTFIVQILNTEQKFSDPSIPINVIADQGFAIGLKSNPTTGYRWEVVGTLPKILQLVNTQFIAPNTRLHGAPGKQVWTLAAVTPGKATITLKYRRPWEKNDRDNTVQKFTVNVGQK